jgi:hypothetical protein
MQYACGNTNNAYKILGEKTQGKRQLWKSTHRLMDNIKSDPFLLLESKSVLKEVLRITGTGVMDFRALRDYTL